MNVFAGSRVPDILTNKVDFYSRPNRLADSADQDYLAQGTLADRQFHFINRHL